MLIYKLPVALNGSFYIYLKSNICLAVVAKCDYRLENYNCFVEFRGGNLAVGVFDRGVKM